MAGKQLEAIQYTYANESSVVDWAMKRGATYCSLGDVYMVVNRSLKLYNEDWLLYDKNSKVFSKSSFHG